MIKEEREKLYKKILEKSSQGLKPPEIAKLYDITRQYVYKVIKREKAKKKKFVK
jgi:Mor family transcriptional regulator